MERVVGEKVKVYRRIQDFKNSEEGLQNRVSKLKAKKDKLQHTFQIYPGIFFDKKVNERVVQLEDPE